MEYFNGTLARELGHLTGWRDRIWARRYQAVLISDEEVCLAGAARPPT